MEKQRLNSENLPNYSEVAPFQKPPGVVPQLPPDQHRGGLGYSGAAGAHPDDPENKDFLLFRDDAPPFVPSVPTDPPPGYPIIGFIDAPVGPPPRYEDIYNDCPSERPEIKSFSVITSDEAREALVNHCKAQRCWGSRAAKDMSIWSTKTTSAFQYRLESFCENRTSNWVYKPYKGQIIDGPENGEPPRPWDVPVTFSEKFKTGKKSLEVSHTAFLKGCEPCQAKGSFICNKCRNRGRIKCSLCHGAGRRNRRNRLGLGTTRVVCGNCNGNGSRRCRTCDGSGKIMCKDCEGRSQMKWFVQLNVQWTNHVADEIYNETDMPKDLVKDAVGDIAFQEENIRVFPISHCPVSSINRASVDLITKHANGLQNERMICQRHTVKSVPVTEVEAQWKDDRFRFFVYGLERKVYTDNYPQTKCCGCSIM